MIYLFRLYWVFTALLGFSLVVASGGYSLVVVLRLLIVVASLSSVVVAHELSCQPCPQPRPRSMWNLPRSGMELMSPVLAGRFLSTAPPGKPLFGFEAVTADASHHPGSLLRSPATGLVSSCAFSLHSTSSICLSLLLSLENFIIIEGVHSALNKDSPEGQEI